MALSLARAAVRDLYDALSAHPDLADVSVWHGYDTGGGSQNELVIVAPADSPVTFSQEWLGLGAGATRDEEITIPVRIDVEYGGSDAFAAADRCWQLAEVIADVLAADPFQTAIYEARPASGTLTPGIAPADGSALAARLDLTVHCTGRISGI